MKSLAYFLLLVSVLSLSAMEVVYYDELSEGGSDGIFEWAIAPDGTAVITGVKNGASTSLTIPARLRGHDVKYLGYLHEEWDMENVFDYYSSLESGSGYWDEENGRYVYNSDLKTIAVESDSKYFTVVNNALFSKDKTVLYYVPPASNVTSYSVPSGVQAIYHRAFSYLETLKSVTIPSGVTEIGCSAFNDCDNLSSVALPSTLKILHEYAFEDCKSLASITLPNSLEEIRSEAFEECRSLTSITIPASVRLIGTEPFDDCRNLKEIKVASGNKFFRSQDGVLFNYDKTKLVQYPAAKSGSSYSIPSGVRIIGVGAFEDVSYLTKITIPNTVTTIEEYAFSDAPLTSVTIPASVTFIGEEAFFCDSLTRSNVKFLGEIPEGAEHAFLFQLIDPRENFEFELDEYGYDYVITRYIGKGTAVSVPSYVQDNDNYNRWFVRGIASGTFANCTKVKSIALPAGLEFIASDAFEGCVSLEKFTTERDAWRYMAEDGVLYYDGSYGKTLFRYPPAKAGKGFIIPEDVQELGECAFDDCVNLTTVYTDNYDLRDAIEDYWPELEVRPVAEAYPFNYSIQDGEAIITGLNQESTEFSPNLVIPASIQGCPVTEIREYAFEDVEIESVVIPDTVTVIDEGAFYRCQNLREVTIPASVTYIGAWAFGGCASLAKFSVASGNTSFQTKDGILYSADGTTLVAYPAGKAGTTFAIPNTVKIIGPGAFDGCEKLIAITIPKSVTEIADDAFSGCTGLKSLAFPEGLVGLPTGVCWGCTALSSVTIPNSVTWIGENAFQGCTGLATITLPASVTEIGYDVFAGCTSLAKFQVANGSPYFKAEDGVLYSADGTALVAYPPGKPGKTFMVPAMVTTIGKCAFETAANLTSVTIPDSVQSIGYGAFFDCAKLTVFTIGDGVQYLDEPAFFIVRVEEYDEEYDIGYCYYLDTDEATGTINTDNEYVREFFAENYPLVTVNYTGPVYDLNISLSKGTLLITL